ncbi:MAG: dihydrodipicolinate synthase family protein, partial [Ilumatobacteraceae bacterium]|nr:dihydrodipicolinate synthase family protein [Ilumatobacteraceae bacterium]
IVPLVTPLREDGSLALEVLPQLIDFVVDAGVTGVVVAGTTGEGYALSMDERALLLQTAMDEVGGRVPVLAGVGGTATREALAQAQQALEAGVHGLMVAAPAYCLPTGPELGEHVLQVLRATQLPTVLYDYPARTGVQFGVDSIDLLAGHSLVVGIKEASGDLSRIAMLHDRYGDDLSVISGSDMLAMHYFESGSDCWIAGFANALPAEHVEMLAAAQRGDMAAGWEVQHRLAPILADVENDHYIARTRFALIARGIPVGVPRAPLQALGADDSAAMRTHLVALGHLASP